MIASTIPLEKQIGAPCSYCHGLGWLAWPDWTTGASMKCTACAGFGFVIVTDDQYDPGEIHIRWRKGNPPKAGNYFAFWPGARVASAQFFIDGYGVGLWYGPGGSDPPLYWAPLPIPAGWARTGLEIEA